jgi:hypothetical protein
VRERAKERKKYIYIIKMKHKRHQKDRKDKDERSSHHNTRAHKEDDHRYYSDLNSKSDQYNKVYTMKNISPNYDEDSSHPKKLIIYIVKIQPHLFTSS